MPEARTTDTPKKKKRVQHLLQVQATERLSPHMVRLTLGGPGFEHIEWKLDTDQYIKLLFADPALNLERPFDMEALREELSPQQMPVTRTYTIRYIDHQKQQIWVDFVVHGDEGFAGPWAERAQVGDTISFFGPGSGYAPRAEADFHLLAGDESALPAIAASVESLPTDARGAVVVEVGGTDDELTLTVPEGVTVTWLHRGGHPTPENALLAEYLRQIELPEGDIHVFVHGERAQMKAARKILVKERGLNRKEMSLSAYWALGRIEDQFQAEKRTPIGQIDDD